MKAQIVAIGNSRGLRLPKAIIEQCGFKDVVELEVSPQGLLVKPVRATPRARWAEAFKRAHGAGS